MGLEPVVGEFIAGVVMALWLLAVTLTLIARGRARMRQFAEWMRSTWKGY